MNVLPPSARHNNLTISPTTSHQIHLMFFHAKQFVCNLGVFSSCVAEYVVNDNFAFANIISLIPCGLRI